MKKHNLGIIGAGMYGKVLMRHFLKDERANIVWVNSASQATTRLAARMPLIANIFRYFSYEIFILSE